MNQGSGGILAVAIIAITILFGLGEFSVLDEVKEAAKAILKAVR